MINYSFILIRFLLLLLFIGFASLGCSTNPVHQTTKKNPDDTSALPELKRVYMSSSLSRNLEVVSINQAKANEDLLRIQVNLANLTKKNSKLVYKTPFEANCVYGFLRNNVSWHTVEPLDVSPEYMRKSININFLSIFFLLKSSLRVPLLSLYT